MHVGVFPDDNKLGQINLCLPHARGGVSKLTNGRKVGILVFPMHVGVFPTKLIL